MAVKERISKLLEALNVGLYERENELKLALLSSIAGESIFFLGLPGVAKSLVAKRLKYAYKGERVFEYLMSRFSTPDEIFGPISISELKKDKYVRVIDGYLPDAEVVFLDEIWKAGPSIQNTLLTILNEKVFRNGKTESEIRDEKNVKIERDVPIKVLISASNELPNEDDKALGQSLDALWDRFLVRFVVDGIEDPEKFNKMIAMSDAPYKDTVADKITDDDYQKWKDAIGKIVIPENVFKVIGAIKEKVRLHNDNVNKENAERQIYISDRRWHKIVRLLRASAFLNDRAEVDLMDCFLIRHCIWNEKEQRNQVWQFVNEAIEEQGCAVSLDLGEIKAGIDKLKKEIEKGTKYYTDIPVKELEPVYDSYYEILDPPDPKNNLITIVDFSNLSNQNQDVKLHSYYAFWQRLQRGGGWNIRKGNSEFSIFINDTEYLLKTIIRDENKQITRGPNEYTEKAWDERVKGLLLSLDDMNSQLEEYKKKNSEYLRTNLFVEPALANIVESHITAAQKEIEKIKLDVKDIQNGYKKLKND